MAAVSVLGWGVGCSDAEVNDPGDSPELQVSDPVRGALELPEAVAFVSLPPGTVPDGMVAVIRRQGAQSSVTAAVIAGGFDPVPIEAAPDDILAIEISGGASGTHALTYRVPARRPPKIVRTVPPRGKHDVPLNQNIEVVFSEPVDPRTLSPSSIRLTRDGVEVAGTVRVLQGATASAVFEPTQALDPDAQYQLVVSGAVRDLRGEPLESQALVDFTTGSFTADQATRVTVLPDTTSIAIGSRVQLVASAHDTNLVTIVGRPITWTSENPAVATVTTSGLVTGRARGTARIRAEMDGHSDVAVVLVSPSLLPVGSVEVVPSSDFVLVGGMLRLMPVVRDVNGAIVRHRLVHWASSAPSIASVTAGAGSNAVLVRHALGTVTITATSEGQQGRATITDGLLSAFTGLSGSCGVTSDARGWCWGGQRLTAVPSALAGGLALSEIAGGRCGLTTGGDAWCWGSNWSGQLGVGVSAPEGGCGNDPAMPCESEVPVAVTGGLKFRTISVGETHVCALTTSGLAYCWGENALGQLGTGTTTGPEQCVMLRSEGNGCSTRPVPVAGTRTYSSLAVGYLHTCALTSAGTTFCWGWNHSGVLGDGSATQRNRPFPGAVAGGVGFVAIAAGGFHNCGLTTDGVAWCWGMNDYGQLGTGATTGPQVCTHPAHPEFGTTNCSTVPVRVASDERWAAISAGFYHTCALSTTGRVFCWGVNYYGNLGIGAASEPVSTPTAVAGDIVFAMLARSSDPSCAITSAGAAYCWGANGLGELGAGFVSEYHVMPVKVAGQP